MGVAWNEQTEGNAITATAIGHAHCRLHRERYSVLAKDVNLGLTARAVLVTTPKTGDENMAPLPRAFS